MDAPAAAVLAALAVIPGGERFAAQRASTATFVVEAWHAACKPESLFMLLNPQWRYGQREH
jgi:hypothetical protein